MIHFIFQNSNINALYIIIYDFTVYSCRTLMISLKSVTNHFALDFTNGLTTLPPKPAINIQYDVK